MEISDKKMFRKEVRKTATKVGLALIICFLINTLVGTIAEPLKNANLVDPQVDLLAIGMILSVLLCTVFLFLFFKSQKIHQQLLAKNKKMTIGCFFILLCAITSIQWVNVGASTALEHLANLFGFTFQASIETSSAGHDTIAMILYASLIGPVIEEIVFRGFIMRALGKYGKTFAILASAIFFAAYHANIPQAIFAFFCGLVLGYIAVEYGIIWSSILHIFNNFILGQVFVWCTQGLTEQTKDIILLSLFGLGALVTIIAVIINRTSVLNYLKENRWKSPFMRWNFSNVFIIIFLVIELLLGISMIKPM